MENLAKATETRSTNCMRDVTPILLPSLLSLLALGGCSSASSSSGVDGGVADAGNLSNDGGMPEAACYDAGYKCGNPCDQGNSKGVGQFCDFIRDCLNTTEAHLCSTLGDPTEHFCTFLCSGPSDAGADAAATSDECGENATCQCSGGQCGCFPNRCM